MSLWLGGVEFGVRGGWSWGVKVEGLGSDWLESGGWSRGIGGVELRGLESGGWSSGVGVGERWSRRVVVGLKVPYLKNLVYS